MKCSLIITTYNWEKALELVLLSINQQTVMPDEVIVADDGSTSNTKNLLSKYTNILQTNLIHCWQEDKGFRAAKSRNNAINKSKFDYIIMIDGDMVLHKNFIRDHLNNAKKNHFIQGGRVLINKEETKDCLHRKKVRKNFFSTGLSNRKNTINSYFLKTIFTATDMNHNGIRSCNMSFFKEDILKVNGFNEDFIGWGREDSEFVARLYNIGVKCLRVKFNCNAYHLYHDENDRKMLIANNKILDNTIKDKLVWCDNGILKK